MPTPIKLYRNPKSGHCHRVELMLAFLGLEYETIDLDMANGAHKSIDFLKISPFGLVPAIYDDGFTLSDSNAILIYLAERYAKNSKWLPNAPTEIAEAQRWLSIAADNIYSGPCAARLVTVFGANLDHKAAIEKSHALLQVMETHLSEREWLASSSISVADVAGYTYVAHAPEGGVDLGAYPKVRAWLERIEAYPNFVGMAPSPIPQPAESAINNT